MYETTTTTTTAATVDSGTAAVIFLIGLIAFLVIYALFAFILGRIFSKAGEAQWKAWVPVYNSWVFLEIGGQKGFWAILAFIPLINIASIVFMIIAAIKIGEHLGKSGAFVLLYVFLPIVWYLWLAFDSSTWQGLDASAASVDSEDTPTFQTFASQSVVEEPQAPTVEQPLPEAPQPEAPSEAPQQYPDDDSQQTPPSPPQNLVQ